MIRGRTMMRTMRRSRKTMGDEEEIEEGYIPQKIMFTALHYTTYHLPVLILI